MLYGSLRQWAVRLAIFFSPPPTGPSRFLVSYLREPLGSPEHALLSLKHVNQRCLPGQCCRDLEAGPSPRQSFRVTQQQCRGAGLCDMPHGASLDYVLKIRSMKFVSPVRDL